MREINMIGYFIKGISQLNDSATRRYVWLSLLATLCAFVIVWAFVGFLLTETTFFQTGWLETATDLLGGAAGAILTWYLFPSVIIAVIGLFLEDIAATVDARHYAHLPAAPAVPFTASLLTSARLLAVMVALNLLLLLFIFTGPLFIILFYAVNGYLLSREYFEVVAHRRISREDAKALAKQNRGRLFLTGVLIAFLLTIPLANLLAPVIATATMVHLFQDLQGATTSSLVPQTDTIEG